jgi:hypothetical protein
MTVPAWRNFGMVFTAARSFIRRLSAGLTAMAEGLANA